MCCRGKSEGIIYDKYYFLVIIDKRKCFIRNYSVSKSILVPEPMSYLIIKNAEGRIDSDINHFFQFIYIFHIGTELFIRMCCYKIISITIRRKKSTRLMVTFDINT